MTEPPSVAFGASTEVVIGRTNPATADELEDPECERVRAGGV